MIYRFPRVYGHMTSGRQWEARRPGLLSSVRLYPNTLVRPDGYSPRVLVLRRRFFSLLLRPGLIHSKIGARVNDITARWFAFQQPRHVSSSSIPATPTHGLALASALTRFYRQIQRLSPSLSPTPQTRRVSSLSPRGNVTASRLRSTCDYRRDPFGAPIRTRRFETSTRLRAP